MAIFYLVEFICNVENLEKLLLRHTNSCPLILEMCSYAKDFAAVCFVTRKHTFRVGCSELNTIQ
jgi:hypothetical protein